MYDHSGDVVYHGCAHVAVSACTHPQRHGLILFCKLGREDGTSEEGTVEDARHVSVCGRARLARSLSLPVMCKVLKFTGKDDYAPGDVGLEAARRRDAIRAEQEEEEDEGVEEAKEEETESKGLVQVWR